MISPYANLTNYSLSIQIHSIPKITNSHCAFKILILFQKSDLHATFWEHCFIIKQSLAVLFLSKFLELETIWKWKVLDTIGIFVTHPKLASLFGWGISGREETDSFICLTNICFAEWFLRAEYSDK